MRDDAKDIQLVGIRINRRPGGIHGLQRQSRRQQKPFHRKLPLHAGDNDIAVPRLFSTVHNQQIAIVQTAVGHAVSAGTQVVRRARMPYAVIMEIQIGLDIVSSRAGKTAAGQIGKQWMGLCPDYTSVSKRAKSVNVSFKTFTRGEIAHLVIDSTGLKVFGEGEWKVKKHGQERRRIWRKLHLAVDSNTHEIICANLSLNNVTDSEAFPGLIRQTHRKIRAASADGAYDTQLCHDELRRKKISALIPPRKGAGYWPGEYADRNRAVANQRLTGSNARWKWTTDYNRRSIAETAMYRVKQLFGGSLTLRDYDGQVAEAMALVRALNKMTKAGMPESVRIA